MILSWPSLEIIDTAQLLVQTKELIWNGWIVKQITYQNRQQVVQQISAYSF